MIRNLSQHINLLVLAVALATLVKLVVILKLRLRNISKRITSLIFLNIYTAPQDALAHIIFLVLKIIYKANSKSDLKIKEALHINLKKPNLNAQQNHLALTHFTIASVTPCSFLSLFPFFYVVFFHFSFIYYFDFLSR